MDYWFTPLEILLTPWPVPVFAVLSGILLLLTLGGGRFPAEGKREDRYLAAYLLIWILLAGISFSGKIQASCLEYADQMIYFIFGVSSFTLAAAMLIRQNEKLINRITGAVVLGMIFSLISGLHQHFVAFDELEEYLMEQSRKTGVNLLTGKVAINLQERRLTADFGICNIYGGFLAALLPLGGIWIWQHAQRFQP